MRLDTQNIFLIVAALFVLLFFGLSGFDRISENISFVEKVESRAPRTIEPLPSISPRVEIKAIFVRDPFKEYDVNGATTEVSLKSWLEESGVVSISNQRALIRLNDGAVYSVRKGDSLLNGKVTITAINPTSVEVRYSEVGDDSDQNLKRIMLSK